MKRAGRLLAIRKLISLGLIIIAVGGRLGAGAAPAGTGFTYQGQMNIGAGAANGTFDFLFRAFDVETAGAQLSLVEVENVAVANGIFTVVIDFGPGVVTGEALWLEIALRPDGDPSPHTTLTPRQRITPAPLAIVAGDALSLGGTPAANYATDAELAAALAGLVAAPPIPAAPTKLRLLPSLKGAPYYRLVWTVENFAGVTNFIVYESPAPITDGNKAAAQKRFTATTELELTIFGNSGKRHFRVAALNFAGGESSLSNEFPLDTALRLVFRSDIEVDEISELYSVLLTGAPDIKKLNGPFLTTSDVSSTYAISPDGARVAYIADQEVDGTEEIYVTPADGSGTAVKVNPPLAAGTRVGQNHVLFTPDGARIIYEVSSTAAPFPTNLFSAPATGGGTAVQINPSSATPKSVNFGPFQISPDSKRVAYAAALETNNLFELYVSPVEGGQTAVKVNPALVAGGNFEISYFAFSPDSARLAYIVDQDIDEVRELYVAPAAGGGTSVKVNPDLPAGREVTHFAFSPDGGRIALIADLDSAGVFDLYMAPANGGGGVTKLNPPLVTGGDVSVYSCQFSPDGAWIAYVADQDVNDVLELYMTPAAGGGPNIKISGAMTTNGDVMFTSKSNLHILHNFSFSPDGQYIFYLADQETDTVNEIYVAKTPAAGGGPAVKVNGALVTGGDVFDAKFAADGSRIVYQADQAIDSVLEMFVAPVMGGGTFARLHPVLDATRDVFAPKIARYGWRD